jgi:4-amino-4-deoxy-L-arabinose transferase-like glycosyltransferase
MILLPAIAIMASTSIDTLQRGASGALNWFGILIFSAITLMLWIGWFALNFGIPYKIHERMVYLSGNFSPELNFFQIFLALSLLIGWVILLWKNNLTNRSSVTNWALGITLAWVTTTLLWFPMIENRKDYGQIFKKITANNISKNHCMSANDLNDSYIDLIFYFTQIEIRKNDKNCKYTITHKDIRSLSNDPEFKSSILWEGKMPNDKKTFYIIKN